MKKTSPMRKLYDSRLFWMIVSFLAALAMWVYFSSTDAEEMTTIFRGVRVELVGEDELRNSRNMVITDLDTNSVTVEVTGPRRIIGGLDSSGGLHLADLRRRVPGRDGQEKHNRDEEDSGDRELHGFSAVLAHDTGARHL